MTFRPGLVLLVHRIPYPPNKGDKIRSFHLLRFLASKYAVHLGTFVDDVRDAEHLSVLRELCADVFAVPIRPFLRRALSLTALVRGEAMSLPYFRSRELLSWVRRKTDEEGIRRLVAFSSPMAQYLPSNGVGVRRVVDFVDVDSEKWRQYSQRRRWPLSWIYRREGVRLLDFERRVAAAASASVFVTPEEAELFRRRAGVDENIGTVTNGVDTTYFEAASTYVSPYAAGAPVVVFTGMMDYWANVDAVGWFAREAFPLVRERMPGARFYIVGARPAKSVKRLSSEPGVHVTGTVPDVRPYLQHAAVAVAPLRVARGVQNKVLEALAMRKPVVASPEAVEGLDIPAELRINVSSDPESMAARVVELMGSEEEAARFGRAGRLWVETQHDWAETLSAFASLIEGDGTLGMRAAS